MQMQRTSYQTEDGAVVSVAYQAKDSPVNYAARREQFCRLMSTGSYDPVEAYCEVWGKDREKGSEAELRMWSGNANRLMQEAQVKLRIDQLKTPVVRKFAKKFEYTVQRAFEQCDEAYQLARIENDAKAMLKAIELQGKFAKLLADQLDVNHRIGVLDDASTEALLGMLAMVQKKRQTMPKIVGNSVAGSAIESPGGGAGAALVPSMGPT